MLPFDLGRVLCPNGCDPSNLVYEQDEITLRAYNVWFAENGSLKVDWESVATEKCLGESETERYLVCLKCEMKRFASVNWDGSFRFVSDALETYR